MKVDLLTRQIVHVPDDGAQNTGAEYNVTLVLTGAPAEFPEQEVEIEKVTERAPLPVEAIVALEDKIRARIADHKACIQGLEQGLSMLWVQKRHWRG